MYLLLLLSPLPPLRTGQVIDVSDVISIVDDIVA